MLRVTGYDGNAKHARNWTRLSVPLTLIARKDGKRP